MEAASLSTATKDVRAVELGRRGAEKRWAGHVARVVRLDDLTTEQRAVVLALVAAARSAKAAVS